MVARLPILSIMPFDPVALKVFPDRDADWGVEVFFRQAPWQAKRIGVFLIQSIAFRSRRNTGRRLFERYLLWLFSLEKFTHDVFSYRDFIDLGLNKN